MPATSKSQRRLMGMAYAYKTKTLDTSNMDDSLVDKVKELASSMSTEELKDYATTKEDNLPDKVKNENVSPGAVPGMGAVTLPGNPGSPEGFSSQTPGSGDIPYPLGGNETDDDNDEEDKTKFKYIKSLKDFLQSKTNI